MGDIAPYILLSNGKQWWFEDPDPSVLDAELIGDTLSKLCRFSGHCNRFYSVAEHSVRLSYLVPSCDAREGLMHDGSEALVVDVPSPLKPLLGEAYKRLESNADRAIAQRFDLRFPRPPSIKQADLIMLATERRDLMPADDREWSLLAGIEPLSMRLDENDYPPSYWAGEFVRRWSALNIGRAAA